VQSVTPNNLQSYTLTSQAIRTIARRYQRGGLEAALLEKQRPGAAAILDDTQKRRIIAMVCSNPPEGRRPLDRATSRLRTGDAIPGRRYRTFGPG
jgi:hypothetical protein